MARHVEHGVCFGMGTDVGAGTGLSMLKEALVAYHVQMVRSEGHMLGPAHLLYLATAAGAKAIGLNDIAGDLTPGKQADLVLLQAAARQHARGRARRRAGLERRARRDLHARPRGVRGRDPRVRRDRSTQDEVVPVHGFLGRPGQHLAHRA